MSSLIDSTLKSINRQTEERAAEQLALSIEANYAMLDNYPFSLDILRLVPLDMASQLHFAPYIKSAKRLRVAVVNPHNQALKEAVLKLAKDTGLEIDWTIVSQSSFRSLLQAYAKLLQEKKDQEILDATAAREAEEHNFIHRIHSLADLTEQISQASTTEQLDALLAAAYKEEASDVHLEPSEADLVVRFRIDGVLQQVLRLPVAQHKGIVSRIKMLANLKLDDHQVTQDGRFSLVDKGIPVDIRVSMVPTGMGEGVVMRLLRRDSVALSLEELGFSEHNLKLIQQAIKRPYGLIVVTGPTGSGKSTTLYALLKKLNTVEKKIITLEDPIEYRLEGVQQSQINPEAGFSFAEGLRGALRQDPDVVMVGEIRDPETATIALNAALTGHLVLTTMHTNDAVTANTRFLELGVTPFLLSGSINLIIAQRLVRKLVSGGTAENPQYKGRVVIAEAYAPTPEIERAVQQAADMSTLQSLAHQAGMISMRDDGLEKVRAGITTEDEVYRVTDI
jgi:type IV pilus assembly protein PilB